MTENSALTISRLRQLTDREIQSNYLNHLDRTPEIANLLSQITDRDLTLRIVNLAFEVDLCLGAILTASIAPELQAIIVNQIDRLELTIDLKIELWCRTKSKAAVPYLRHLQQSLVSTLGDWQTDRTIESVNKIILYLEDDLDLELNLLIASLYKDPYFFGDKSLENLTRLALEATEAIGDLLINPDFKGYAFVHNSIEVLRQIGTPAAIAKIRDALNVDRSRWSDPEEPWIEGLAIVAESAMVEHLIYLLHFSAEYIHRSSDYLYDDEYYTNNANRLCLDAIEAIEYVGGDLAFEILHRSLYWINNDDEYPNLFEKNVEALFRLDRERTLTAIAGAIHSYDSTIKKRAINALTGFREIPIEDRNLEILLDALNDPEVDVRLEIIDRIREIGSVFLSPYYSYDNSWIKIRVDRELVITIIRELREKSDEEPMLPIFDEFLRNPDFTRQFLEIIETTTIDLMENIKPRDLNILLYLGWIAITDRAVITIARILKSDECTYDDEDGGVNALEYISTALAINTLLELLPDKYVLGGWIANSLARVGKLGVIPHLWSSQCQYFSLSLAETINYIQKEEGLYNPDFSERNHPLFQPVDNLRRKILAT